MEALPEVGFRLEATAADATIGAGFIESANILALRSNRVVARYVFSTEGNTHQASASAVVKVILYTQRVANVIASRHLQIERPSGAIPFHITDQTALLTRPIRASSLGIELVSEYQADLFSQSLVGETFDTLGAIMQSKGDVDRLRQQFSTIPKRALKWYRSLMSAVAESGVDVSVEIGHPVHNGEQQIFFARSQVPTIVDVLTDFYTSQVREREFNAKLIGYDSEYYSFHFKALEDGTDYKGKATGDEAIDTGREAKIGVDYRVRMLEFVEFDPITEEPILSYELLSFVRLKKEASED